MICRPAGATTNSWAGLLFDTPEGRRVPQHSNTACESPRPSVPSVATAGSGRVDGSYLGRTPCRIARCPLSRSRLNPRGRPGTAHRHAVPTRRASSGGGARHAVRWPPGPNMPGNVDRTSKRRKRTSRNHPNTPAPQRRFEACRASAATNQRNASQSSKKNCSPFVPRRAHRTPLHRS